MTLKKVNGRMSQLKLLMWKNFLQQIRSPIFTTLEFIVPLLLIGITFGLMIALRHKYELSHPSTTYKPWIIQGSIIDLIIPPDFSQIFVDTIVDTQYIISGKTINDDCIFLNITRQSNDSNILANIDLEIVYTPTNPAIDEIMQIIQERYTTSNIVEQLENDVLFGELDIMKKIDPNMMIKISSTTKLTPKKNEEELVKYIMSSLSEVRCNNPIIGGIVFDENFANSVNSTDTISYSIRLSNTKRRYQPLLSTLLPWNTEIKFAVPIRIGPLHKFNPSGGNPGYWQEGFLTLQKAIDVAIQQYLSNATNNSILMLQRFPYPSYKNVIIELGVYFLSTVVVFSFLINVVYITRTIVTEKETQMKSYMKVMGLSQWILWLSHFISNLIKLSINVIILSALYYVVTPKSDPTIAFVLFMLYAFNVIYVAFAASAFLHSGAAAMQIIPFIWVVLYGWHLLFNIKDLISPFSPSIRLLNALNPDIALTYALGFMCQHETLGSGASWSQLFVNPTPDEPLTLGHFLVMLIIDATIFAIITWYVEAVNPGFDGVPQKPYFFLQRSYWFGKNKIENLNTNIQTNFNDSPNVDSSFIEIAPKTLRAAVEIIDLCKTYEKPFLQRLLYCNFTKKKTKAVNHLYTKIYSGQITVLLGQNGAGKSTIFSILTGVRQPSSGTAYIEGYDIRKELSEIQTRLGFCPQYNIIFDCLTVMEHLQFFCKLKGRCWQMKEANDILKRLKIDHKANVYGHYLSGGQKRKLSLAIALIGCSEVILLDEPTSGMDPDSRRETWSLLQDEKKRRTILLTTHYMDEADILGDRIIIIAYGELQCIGSGLFLKKKFAGEYRLTILYNENKNVDEHAKIVLKTLALLREFIPDVIIHSSNGLEVTFLLPADQRYIFPNLFQQLEENTNLLEISTFGVSVATMEEVFLRVCQRAAEKLLSVQDSDIPEDKKHHFDVSELKYETHLQGYSYYRQHFRAMFHKRFAYFFRKRTFFLLELLFPAICMLLIMEACMMIPVPKEQPKLPINFQPYYSGATDANINVRNIKAAYFQRNLSEVIQEAAALNVMHKYPFQLTITDDINKELIESLDQQKDRGFGLHNPVAYNYYNNLFAHDWFIAMFNNYALHSPPLAVNLADIAILSKSIQRNISIQVSNHPLPPAATDTLKSQDVINQAALTIGFAAIMSLSAVVASFINFIIYERTTKSKHMQIMYGLRHWTYWLTAFLWDITVFLIPATLCIAVFFIADIKEFTTRSTVTLTVYVIMLLYAWAELPFIYWCSTMFKSPTNGNATICVYNFVTGMIGAVAVSIVEKASSKDTANTLSIILSLLFPTYNLSLCFSKAYTNEHTHAACKIVDCSIDEIRKIAKECCGNSDERLYVDNMLISTGKMGMALMIVFLILHSIIFWLAIAASEINFIGIIKRLLLNRDGKISITNKIANTEIFQTCNEDMDVMMEREKIREMKNNDASVIVRNLEKWYGNVNAVNKINFHVAKGECFGLLGINGAGKTTTFQMLTGESKSCAGDAYIYGFNIQTEWRKAYDHIGYCPQFDALIGEMTGQETLQMFARLRGVKECDIMRITDTMIDAVALNKYKNNLIKTYSGGNKRRLSLGVALLTLPDVLLLDEPTTGVDPKASRIIWNILSKIRESDTALVLTSHSMEECDALCTQIAIMTNGEFRCLGSTQHIKSKYGSGYSLAIRLYTTNQIESAKELITKMFPNARLMDEHILHLNYELMIEKGQKWSMLFEKVGKLAELIDAADYSISQTTLDQIFLDFSRNARTDIVKSHF